MQYTCNNPVAFYTLVEEISQMKLRHLFSVAVFTLVGG